MTKVYFLDRKFLRSADGGTGLFEALEKYFPGLQFILDRPHLKEHVYAGVEAMELPTKVKKFINNALVGLIDAGEVESAHKYIPQKRLKIAGATWHPDTINPMLALRIMFS